jgi:MerR family transcriptional regulator/heat shock protein HspR
MKKYFIQIYSHTPSIEIEMEDDDNWVDVASLGIHPDIAGYLAEIGLVDFHRGHIPAHQAPRLQKLLRLRSNLGVNLPGAAIIVDLLDRMEELQEELERLRRR